MIENDWDDNKFIDCAVAAGATYIVSDDAHFRILKKIDFPPLNLLTGEEFVEVLKGNIN
jgi:predicted nucleic acid-binding protein